MDTEKFRRQLEEQFSREEVQEETRVSETVDALFAAGVGRSYAPCLDENDNYAGAPNFLSIHPKRDRQVSGSFLWALALVAIPLLWCCYFIAKLLK